MVTYTVYLLKSRCTTSIGRKIQKQKCQHDNKSCFFSPQGFDFKENHSFRPLVHTLIVFYLDTVPYALTQSAHSLTAHHIAGTEKDNVDLKHQINC